ncbi:MAG TPA: MBL fold metallo-hydrolase [Gammaproteobacteria bacterium]|nr:MBL fold metallo-hydrolase [Gammaproteobacteria bacterium]
MGQHEVKVGIQPAPVQKALEGQRPGEALSPADTLTRVADGVYATYGVIGTVDAFNRGFNGNAYFVETGDGVVVIDALGSPRLGRQWVKAIRAHTDEPIRYLILTHNHPDHSFGAIAFRRMTDATVIAHPGTERYLNSTPFEESVAYRKELLPEDFEGFAPVRPDEVVAPAFGEPLEISLGGTRFQVYNVGGHHSFGDLVIHMPERGITFVSDLYFQNRMTYMADGDVQDYFRANEFVTKNLDTRLMVPGHGVVQEGPPFPMRDKTVSYVRRLRDMMKEAVQNMTPLAQAVDKAAHSFPEWKDTALYEENHRKNANFMYTEMEQAVLFGGE